MVTSRISRTKQLCKADAILECLKRVRGMGDRPSMIDLKFMETAEEACDVIIVLKHELLVSSHEYENRRAIETVIHNLDKWPMRALRARVYNGAAVAAHGIVRSLYPELAVVAESGLRGCPLAVRERVLAVARSASVISARRILRDIPSMSPIDLAALGDSVGCHKFGAGVYGATLTFGSRQVTVLNPFYPHQEEWLGHHSGGLVAVWYRTSVGWPFLRARIVGGVHPQCAHTESLRGTIFRVRHLLGVSRCSLMYNHIHVSPGPVEAARQLAVLFELPLNRATRELALFGRLKEAGLGSREAERFVFAPHEWVVDGQTLAERTEDANLDVAIREVTRCAEVT